MKKATENGFMNMKLAVWPSGDVRPAVLRRAEGGPAGIGLFDFDQNNDG